MGFHWFSLAPEKVHDFDVNSERNTNLQEAGKIVIKVVSVSSCEAAGLAELLEDIFRSVNLAFVNELQVLCFNMGINGFEVVKAASTKPFGYMPYLPGPCLARYCIPISPFYLT